MDIFATEGFKIKVTEKSLENGCEIDQHDIKKYLELNKIYTVFFTVINDDGENANVDLYEIENHSFNCKCFEDIGQTTSKTRMTHDQYYQFNPSCLKTD